MTGTNSSNDRLIRLVSFQLKSWNHISFLASVAAFFRVFIIHYLCQFLAVSDFGRAIHLHVWLILCQSVEINSSECFSYDVFLGMKSLTMWNVNTIAQSPRKMSLSSGIFQMPLVYDYTPSPLKVEWGYTGFIPMSVRPSVRRQSFRNFLKKTIGSIHFIPGICPYGVSLLTPIHFRVLSLIFGPLVAKYLAENGVSGTFWKNYWRKSFHTWEIYPYGVSLLTPIYFRVPSLIFRPLVAKHLCYNGTWLSFCVFSIDFAVLWQIFDISQNFYINCCDLLSTMTL